MLRTKGGYTANKEIKQVRKAEVRLPFLSMTGMPVFCGASPLIKSNGLIEHLDIEKIADAVKDQLNPLYQALGVDKN